MKLRRLLQTLSAYEVSYSEIHVYYELAIEKNVNCLPRRLALLYLVHDLLETEQNQVFAV